MNGMTSLDLTRKKNKTQAVWGTALILMGIAVFFRVPQVMPRIEQIPYFSSGLFFIRFCFYLMGTLLICGGIRKLFLLVRPPAGSAPTLPTEE